MAPNRDGIRGHRGGLTPRVAGLVSMPMRPWLVMRVILLIVEVESVIPSVFVGSNEPNKTEGNR